VTVLTQPRDDPRRHLLHLLPVDLLVSHPVYFSGARVIARRLNRDCSRAIAPASPVQHLANRCCAGYDTGRLAVLC
jgi:hypothetical protein